MDITKNQLKALSRFEQDQATIFINMIKKWKFKPVGKVNKLLIFGTNDALVSDENYEKLSKMSIEKTDIVLIENGGHFASPEGFQNVINTIQNFLKLTDA